MHWSRVGAPRNLEWLRVRSQASTEKEADAMASVARATAGDVTLAKFEQKKGRRGCESWTWPSSGRWCGRWHRQTAGSSPGCLGFPSGRRCSAFGESRGGVEMKGMMNGALLAAAWG
jgi:hypothetical protein